MSFNRRDRPDRSSRPPQRRSGGDWQPRDQRPSGDRPYQPRDQRPSGDRPYQPRPYQPRGGGDRSYAPRPDRAADEGGMSIRLDPRRLSTLKRLAADAGMRPGDLVRTWVEERIDGERSGAGGASLAEQLAALAARVEALERSGGTAALAETASSEALEPEAAAEPAAEPAPEDAAPATPPKRTRAKSKASAKPAHKVALHDEMIAVLSESGPMTAAELAAAVAERDRYHPPRSGRPIDAAMISQRVSNPTYRSRFTRAGGRIGLAS